MMAGAVRLGLQRRKRHAMKRLFAITILGLASLAIPAQQAAAGWLWDHCCHHCCCSLKVNAKQYNAFSPYCIDSVSGCCPGPVTGAWGNGQGPGCQDGGACQELPATGPVDGHAAIPPQAANGTISGMPVMVPGSTQMLMPGAASQAMPHMIPGMANGNVIMSPAMIAAPANFGR
jgi:hypothetical protein